ncbi:MAG: hypothetical protein CMN32_01665 [Saprospirales bacterium]|nr:hypothetical protein [Saprospirales bacterium]
MYLINKEQNRITKLEEKSFHELGLKERDNLQEWLRKNPESLGEELLIIQKEFSGFSDTNERLDLLALDDQGNLVIIENKLDSSGKDVVWQVLKYASYCASLSKDQIKDIYQSYLDKEGNQENAVEKLSEFFNNTEYEELVLNQGQKQRIIMVAGHFRKEVTSTVLWLMNYKIRIQCFKVTPYAFSDQLFLKVEQILPLKEAEEFAIRMAEKTQEDISSQETLKARHHIRLDFWSQFIKKCNKVTPILQNVSPSKDNWIGTGIGLTGVGLNLVVSRSYARTEIYINRGSQEENKEAFDFIKKFKDEIEPNFQDIPLIWERMDDKVTCRIKHQLDNVSIFNKEDWPKMTEFMIDSTMRMEKAFKRIVKKLGTHLKK